MKFWSYTARTKSSEDLPHGTSDETPMSFHLRPSFVGIEDRVDQFVRRWAKHCNLNRLACVITCGWAGELHAVFAHACVLLLH